VHPLTYRLVGGAIGVACAVLIIVVYGIGAPSTRAGPVVVAPAGDVIPVPAYQNTTTQNGGLTQCQERHDCGVYGIVELNFTLSGSAHLSGILNLTGPLMLDIANGVGLRNIQCDFTVPQANCSVEAGIGCVSFDQVPAGTFDLGGLGVTLSSGSSCSTPAVPYQAGDQPPPTAFTIYLVNAVDRAVSVVTVTPIVATPIG
jgi:hypothetical protein